MSAMSTLGKRLYTGEKSFDFAHNWKRNLGIGVALCSIALILLGIFRLNPGIEFRGGSEFRVTGTQSAQAAIGTEIAEGFEGADSKPLVTVIGDDSVRVQTSKLDEDQTNELKRELAEGYDVDPSAVSASFVGPTWGEDVTRQALIGLLVFLALVAIVISLYFRTPAMAMAALVALGHDLLITVGVFSATRFEVSPASVIGFLTILGYSLYDTVVVFDKVRENTMDYDKSLDATYAERVNLAVNQTLVRSVNTSIVALLPVGAILFIGVLILGAGTLRDISLALFVGMLVGTYSSIFVAPSAFVLMRSRDKRIQAHNAAVAEHRAAANAPESEPVSSRPARVAPGHQREQPKRR